MENSQTTTATSDERIMAALSHASVLFPLIGIFAPILIWVTQREKSKYVAFQSLQALAFQLSMVVAWFLGWGCYMVSFFGFLFTMSFSSAMGEPSTLSPLAGVGFFIPFAVLFLILVGGLIFVVCGLVGAVKTLQGKPFRYALIANRVEKFLQSK